MPNNDYLNFEPLSNFDLMEIMAKEMKERANIIDTRTPEKYKTFDDLWKGKGHCILFEMPDPNASVGHWTVLIRQKNGSNGFRGGKKGSKESCIYFDSYGSELKDKHIKKLLKQKYDVIQYNPKRLQEYDTNLCGAYSLICVCLNKMYPKINVKDILKVFEQKGKNENFDQFVYKLSKDLQ